MKAEELKTIARNYVENINKKSELPIDIVARKRMARMEESYKEDAKHAEEFAKGETSAEEFGNGKKRLKTLKLRAEKSRLKAVMEENKKFKLKTDATNIIGKKLRAMRDAYSKGNDELANSIALGLKRDINVKLRSDGKWSEHLQQVVVQDAMKADGQPTLVPPYKKM